MKYLIPIFVILLFAETQILAQPTRQGGPVRRGNPVESQKNQQLRVLRRMRDYARFIQSNSGLGPRRFSTRKKSKRRVSKVVKQTMMTKKIMERYADELVNRDYFLVRLRPFRDCSGLKKKKLVECELDNTHLAAGARSVSLIRKAFTYQEWSDLTILRESAVSRGHSSLEGSQSYTLSLMSSLGKTPMKSLVYGEPTVKALREARPFHRDLSKAELAWLAWDDYKQLSIKVGEEERVFSEKVELIPGDTYLIRIVMPEYKENPSGGRLNDQIYAFKVLEVDENEVVTLVFKTIWTWNPS